MDMQTRNIAPGGNGAPAPALKIENRLPGHLCQVQSDEPDLSRVTQGKSSVFQPQRAGDLHHEKQINSNTCSLHALRAYVGARWIHLGGLEEVGHEVLNEILGSNIGEACRNFVETAMKSEQSMVDALHYFHGGNVENIGNKIEYINKLVSDLNECIRKGQWGKLLDTMKLIRGMLTNSDAKPPIPIPQPPHTLSELSRLSNYEKIIRGVIEGNAIGRGAGADPLVAKAALAKIDPKTRLASPGELGLHSNILDEYNLRKLCDTLSQIETDRAIICGRGHFIALRCTDKDGWCPVDSKKANVVPIGPHSTTILDKEFHGVIYSTQENLDEFLVQRFSRLHTEPIKW
ncbi:MAG: hypothetical protein LBS87_03545 [Puniceicoccales bacterium]|nr:hypothetical protein [Puniceicoccales bacterium]